MLDIPTGDTARERWLGLTQAERRKILADGSSGRAQGVPELARIAAGWARTAADESRQRSLGYLAAVLVAAAGGLAVGGLIPRFARVGALVWFGLVCLVAVLAGRLEAQQRQVYAWVETCNLNYLLCLAGTETIPPQLPGRRYVVRYHPPPGRYAIVVVAVLLPLGSAMGTGASALTVALALLVTAWAAIVVGLDRHHRSRPLAVLGPAGVDLPRLRLVVPWHDVGWVFVGIRGRRFAVGAHWVLHGPSTGTILATRAGLPHRDRFRLHRRLSVDPRFTVPCLRCQESPEDLVLISAAVQRSVAGSQATDRQQQGHGHLRLLA